MGSPEVITQVKELTTPVAGEGDVSYGLVVHSNKGSYEPTWYSDINTFKQERTPNGAFEATSASAMYAVKKYCEAGDVQLLVVRPNTGALMSGLKVIDSTPTMIFGNIGLTDSDVVLGNCITYNKKSYICTTSTKVPEEIDAEWLADNFEEITEVSDTEESLIDFENLKGFKQGTTLYFEENPSTATFQGVTTYPAYMAVLPNSTLQNGDLVFGWYCNAVGESWQFGYAVYNNGVFVEDTTPVISNQLYTLPKDIVAGTSDFWTLSESTIENSYDYIADIKVQTNLESYTVIQNSGLFEDIPAIGTTIEVGTGIWYGGAPYICAIETEVPSDISAPWLNYYFNTVGKTTASNYVAWTTGVNLISEYTQADDELLTFYSANGGLWGNSLSVSITNYIDDPDEIELENCFLVTFYNAGTQVEQYRVSRVQGLLDENGNSMYIEDVINKRSVDFRVKDNTALPSNLLPTTLLNPVQFAGGANGSYPTDAQMIKALNLMADEAQYPLFCVGDGGYTTVNYAKAIQTFVNGRKGTKGVACVPQVAVVTSSMSQAYSNISSYLVDLNMSDSKMRVEEYWSYEFDADTGKTVLIPPDGLYARNEALTKRNEGLYYPNAGWTNGMINTDLVNKWNKGYRDLLDKVRVNYCKYDRNKGSCVFSEQTTLARPSYLQQDHIVKVILDIIPKHIDMLETFLLRLAEDGVFNQIKYQMDASMRTVQNNHGCDWFENTCGRVNNSQETLDQQIVNVWCEFRPINSIKIIKLTYGLTNQSVRLVDVQG